MVHSRSGLLGVVEATFTGAQEGRRLCWRGRGRRRRQLAVHQHTAYACVSWEE